MIIKCNFSGKMREKDADFHDMFYVFSELISFPYRLAKFPAEKILNSNFRILIFARLSDLRLFPENSENFSHLQKSANAGEPK